MWGWTVAVNKFLVFSQIFNLLSELFKIGTIFKDFGKQIIFTNIYEIIDNFYDFWQLFQVFKQLFVKIFANF